MVKLSPSILSADFSRLGEDIRALEEGGADFIHIDVMDGNFVPNISFGIPIIKSIRNLTKIPFDVHLMIEEPGRYAEDFLRAGADILTIHYEAERHLDRTLNLIKSFGAKAAIALNPATPVSLLKNVINVADMILIMTVNPGFGGQSFIPYTLDKLRELKELTEGRKDFLIEVDGGIDAKNVASVVESGANVIVAGSFIFKNGRVTENIKEIKKGFQL